MLIAWTLEACVLTTNLFRDLDGGEELRERCLRKFPLADADRGVITIISVASEVATETGSHKTFTQ